ncbi:MAG: hypothetical protein AAGA54_08040 [Myxococcota bacterium]
MVASYIAEIERLAGAFRANERNLPLYFPDFETAPAEDSLNRVFGAPVGLTDADWPTYPHLGELLARANQLESYDETDLRMEHVFTIDLRDINLLGAPPRARAMMLFISNTTAHWANHNGNTDTAVVFLSDDELARGSYRGALPRRSQSRWSRRFSLARIDVPGDVFDPVDEEDSPIALLHDAIWQAPARLGGCPIWVREPSDPRDFTPVRRVHQPASTPGPRGRNAFMMQFEERFANINLGQQGVMYVSGVGAYYQSYD